MNISSPSFKDGAPIPKNYTCDGMDINPPLEIDDVPYEALSLVLVVENPDASYGDGVHWLVWNIDPLTEEIEEDSIPEDAEQGQTSFGTTMYVGPRQKTGETEYNFKLYALDTILEIEPNSTIQDIEDAIDDHIIEEAVLTCTY